MTAISYGLISFSSLVTIIDPIASAPIFVGLTQHATPAERRAMARRACLTALALLSFFALAGSSILKLFGITMHAFRIAGGILFFSTGAGMLSGRAHAQGSGDTETDLAIVPLAMPVICGPGSLSTVMLLMGQAVGPAQVASFFLALGLAMWVTWWCLLVAPTAMRFVGQSGVQVATQVMGLILTVLGVQFIVDGIRPLVLEILKG